MLLVFFATQQSHYRRFGDKHREKQHILPDPTFVECPGFGRVQARFFYRNDLFCDHAEPYAHTKRHLDHLSTYFSGKRRIGEYIFTSHTAGNGVRLCRRYSEPRSFAAV